MVPDAPTRWDDITSSAGYDLDTMFNWIGSNDWDNFFIIMLALHGKKNRGNTREC
jgi:hypothetical protein